MAIKYQQLKLQHSGVKSAARGPNATRNVMKNSP